mgnify:CR=1 FL=1
MMINMGISLKKSDDIHLSLLSDIKSSKLSMILNFHIGKSFHMHEKIGDDTFNDL